ncbi:MAG: hypothetical protein HYW50_02075 [Candidatus Diapherotrites archaeon]|nr:hypothetical protein [Candidatus Diapherotrites archaeon]
MILVGIGAASIFMVTKIPPIEEDNGWKESLFWLKDNTPPNAKMFNWWDQGHWVSYFAERAVLTDNRNISGEANTAFANFIISENEEEAFKIVKEFNSDYLIVNSDHLSSLNSLGLYAYNTTNAGDPRITKYFGTAFNCNEQTDQLTGQKTFSCGPNNLNEAQINTIPTKWVSEPNQLIDKQVPGFVYRNPDNSTIFILNPATNNSMIAKLWFNEGNLKHFEPVHENKKVKIFKIID